MRVLLINPLVREWAKPNCVPLGLCYIAACMQRAGAEVEIFDINALRPSEKEIRRHIADARYDWAGIGGIITTYRYVKWLAGLLKEAHPDRPVVVGGALGSSFAGTLLERTPVDAACVGEGELTSVDICSGLASGAGFAQVKGLAWRQPDGTVRRNPPQQMITDLDTLPFPARELVPMNVYLRNPVGAPNRNKWADGSAAASVLTTNIMGTRGCPYRCIYCYHDFLGYKYRTRGPDNVVAEIRKLREDYGVDYVHFIDDEFMLKREFVRAFCEALLAWGAGVTWGCTGRVNLVDAEILRLMRRAGCVHVNYGIESGSQRMLDLMKKQVTADQALEAIRVTREIFGETDISLMVGLPGETAESIGETVDFCKRAGVAPQVIFFATPYPGTELYRMALERGRIPDEEEYVLLLAEQGERIACNPSDIPDDELRRLRDAAVAELGAWNRTRHAGDGATSVPGGGNS